MNRTLELAALQRWYEQPGARIGVVCEAVTGDLPPDTLVVTAADIFGGSHRWLQ